MLSHVIKESSRLSRLIHLSPSKSSSRHSLLSKRCPITRNAAIAHSGGVSNHEDHGNIIVRFYSPSLKRMDEAEGGQQDGDSDAPTKPPTQFTKAEKKKAARDYNSRRAAYNRQVSAIRKQYFEQIAKEKAAEEARLNREQAEITRRRLERQRLKNIRSGQNALREEEKRLNREKEFNEYLRQKQAERDEKKRRYGLARGMVLTELEAEAHLWLTTPEEVEAAFTHEAEQMLWARPNGVLGSPTPSVDSHFWQHETHTMHMDKTYKSQRELLLEEILEYIYEESMVDENFWNEERLKDRIELEERAKLRAMVRSAGRRALLERQKQMLEDYYGTTDDEVPKKMPAPNVKILANIKAQEREGVKILMKDPTKFFRFENQEVADNDTSGVPGGEEEYSGPSLGAPAGLRDELRDGTPWSGVFPIGIGKLPKADTRTQREKKRQEREQKMWEAAEAEKISEDKEVEMAAEDDVFGLDDEDDVNYNSLQWDADNEEWEKGLDPVADADLLKVPHDQRYSEEDIRWVISQLEKNSTYLQSQMNREIDSTRQRMITQREVDEETTEEKDMKDLLFSLTNEQMLALVEVDSQNLEAMSPSELSDALSKVPGLDEEQVKRILELGDSLSGGGNTEQPDDKDS